MSIIITFNIKSHEAKAFTTKKAAADYLATTPKTILHHTKSGKPIKHITFIRSVTIQKVKSMVRRNNFR